MTLPIRISVRVDFDDGSQHDYEVRGPDTVPAPGGFWPMGVVTSDVAQRIEYDRKRAREAERLRDERDQAVKLLEAALHLHMNGERAPGGNETWAALWRDVEAFLRARLDAEDAPSCPDAPRLPPGVEAVTADEPAPVMLKVAGKRFACERCGANVFSRSGENFACNGCGTLYGGKEGQ